MFGLNVLQDHSDSELLSLLCQAQSFFSGGQATPRHADLFGLRLQPGESFHDLSDNFIMDFFRTDPRRIQTRFRGALAREIKNTTRPDAPTDADEVILLIAKTAGVAVLAPAQAARESGSADGRNQRAVNRAVLVFSGGCDERLTLFQLRAQ